MARPAVTPDPRPPLGAPEDALAADREEDLPGVPKPLQRSPTAPRIDGDLAPEVLRVAFGATELANAPPEVTPAVPPLTRVAKSPAPLESPPEAPEPMPAPPSVLPLERSVPRLAPPLAEELLAPEALLEEPPAELGGEPLVEGALALGAPPAGPVAPGAVPEFGEGCAVPPPAEGDGSGVSGEGAEGEEGTPRSGPVQAHAKPTPTTGIASTRSADKRNRRVRTKNRLSREVELVVVRHYCEHQRPYQSQGVL